MAPLWIALLIGTSTALAEDSAETRIAELEQRVRLLEAKLQLLEAELTAVRSDMAARGEPAPVGSVVEAVAAEKSLFGKANSPAIRQFSSVTEMLRALPAGARPHPSAGWDRARRDKADLWFSEHMPGTRFHGRLEAAFSVNLRQSVQRDAGRSIEYLQMIKLSTEPVDFAGLEIRSQFNSYAVRGDADRIETLERAMRAPSLPVAATIESVSLVPRGGNTWILNIKLKDVEIIHPAFERPWPG